MSRGIMIFGSSCSGKSTLGKMTADALGFPYIDIDDYIWRWDTPLPYTALYSREERAARLMEAISRAPRFVMGGSMDSIRERFEPLFDLAVHLTADVNLRLERARRREYERFGDRVHEGGDMYKSSEEFYKSVAGYDTDTEKTPNMKLHSEWAASMKCRVLRLDGAEPLERNRDIIVGEYREIFPAG